MDYQSVLQEQIRELQKAQDSATASDEKCRIAEQISRIVVILTQQYGG